MDEGESETERDGSGFEEVLIVFPSDPDPCDEESHGDDERGGAYAEGPSLHASSGTFDSAEDDDDESSQGVGADDEDGDHDLVVDPTSWEDDGGDSREHRESDEREECPEDEFSWDQHFNE